MLAVTCWRWGGLFGAVYVNRLRAALERHLHIEHELVCVTDDAVGIDRRVRVVSLPSEFAHTPRCRRRMQQFDHHWGLHALGARILSIDLDVVIVDDITPLVDRPEPIVAWKVGHAGVYSGSFLLFDAGALHGAWAPFAADPDGYPRTCSPHGTPSDQAMLNHYLRRTGIKVAELTEADGIVTYYGRGYERLEHLGVGPTRSALPPGARLVVLGSADKHVMDEARFGWVLDHWSSLPAAAQHEVTL